MKYVKAYLLGILLLPALVSSCSKGQDDHQPVPNPIIKPVPEPVKEGLISLSSDWIKNGALTTSFPKDIEVYRRTTSFNNRTMHAWCVVFNPASTVLEFKPVLVAKNTKLADIYKNESGVKYAAINAGFFGTNVSYSLVMDNREILAQNIRSLNRPFNQVSTPYYPTRGAFGINASGKPDISWIYHVGTGNGVIYSYPAPAPNALDHAPAGQPSSLMPEGGKIWDMVKAVGGSPVLLKDGQVRITDTEELISIDNTSLRARSAIGFTSEGNVVLLAVEGNNSSGGAGLTLNDLALLMKEMGCTAALNLDGGGSTSMIVNDSATIKPSDTAGERPVVSAIIIKKK